MKFSGAIIIILFGLTPNWAAEIRREPLDEIWQKHMIDGTAASYYDGVKSDVSPRGSFSNADGNPDNIWPTTKGIRIDDLRETRLWGLLRKGGWRMEGGLLAQAGEGQGSIDFYGKSVWRVPPVLFDFGKSPPWFAEHSYEFFLLYRPREGEKATLLKKWVIPPDQIPYDFYLRGTLHYNTVSKVATVKVVDVDNKRMFIEDSIELLQTVRP